MIENSATGAKSQHTALRAAENVDRSSHMNKGEQEAQVQNYVTPKELHEMMTRHLENLHSAEAKEEGVIGHAKSKLESIRISIRATIAALNTLQGDDEVPINTPSTSHSRY